MTLRSSVRPRYHSSSHLKGPLLEDGIVKNLLARLLVLAAAVALLVGFAGTGTAWAQAPPPVPPFPWGPYPIPTALGPINVQRTTLLNLPTTWAFFPGTAAAPAPLVRNSSAGVPPGAIVGGQLIEAFDFGTPVAGYLGADGNQYWSYWKAILTTNCAGFASTQVILEDDNIQESLINPATGNRRIRRRKALVGSADPVEAAMATFDTGGKYILDGPQLAALRSIPVDGVGLLGNLNAEIGFDVPTNGLLNPPVLTPGKPVPGGWTLVRKDYISTVRFITYLYQNGNQLYAIVEWGYDMDLFVAAVGGVLTNNGLVTSPSAPNILTIAGMTASTEREIQDDLRLLNRLLDTGRPQPPPQ